MSLENMTKDYKEKFIQQLLTDINENKSAFTVHDLQRAHKSFRYLKADGTSLIITRINSDSKCITVFLENTPISHRFELIVTADPRLKEADEFFEMLIDEERQKQLNEIVKEGNGKTEPDVRTKQMDQILEILSIWKKYPQLRFGQFLLNACRGEPNWPDIWNVSDDKLLERVVAYSQYLLWYHEKQRARKG